MDDTETLPPDLEPFQTDMDELTLNTVSPPRKESESGENVEENGAEVEEEVEEEEEDNPFADDDDSDEEGGQVQVTIRKVDATAQFQKPAQQNKLDIDSTPLINDKPIYDMDLAQMVDRPWRKPGADITDYFNYGFTEDTWNMYCERQKKLRLEFGNQAAANKSLFSSITLANPLAQPIATGNQGGVIKVLTDNGGRFKPNQQFHSTPLNTENVMRTVISASQPQKAVAAPVLDFSKPPPGMSMPPPSLPSAPSVQTVPSVPSVQVSTITQDAPPGVDAPVSAAESLPPSTPLPSHTSQSGAVPTIDMNLQIPPPNFNPMMPPPGIPPPIGMMTSNLPPPGFGLPPPTFQAQHSRAGFGQQPLPSRGNVMASSVASYGSGGGSRDTNDYDDDDDRRLRRKRSRSRSPSKRDRETRRRGDRDRDRDRDRQSSRRHRSRSSSRDRKSYRDDRDKRRDRRDDDDRSKKSSRSRRDDDDERRERKEKSRKYEDDADPEPNNDESPRED